MQQQSRFTVGEAVPFVSVRFVKSPRPYIYQSLRSIFGITRMDNIQDVQLLLLTCVSEHPVAVEYDVSEEKNCLGYIFADDAGNTWHNQYPWASFGQLHDDADTRVTWAGHNGVRDFRAWIHEHPDFIYQFKTLTSFMDELREITDHPDNQSDPRVVDARALHDMILHEYYELTGNTLRYQTMVLDGEEIPEVMHHVVIPA